MKKAQSLGEADVGVLLGSWTTYGIAFGCAHEQTLVVFDTIPRLKEKYAEVMKHIEENAERQLQGGGTLVLIEKSSVKMTIIPLNIPQECLAGFRRLARNKNELVRAIALACWKERGVLLRIL